MISSRETQIADLALAAHPVATLVVDLQGLVLYSNSAAEKAFGLDKSSGPSPFNISDWQLHRMLLPDLLRFSSMSSNWMPAVFLRDDLAIHAKVRGLRPDSARTPRVLITSVPDATTPFLTHAQQIKKLNSQLAFYQKIAKELRTSVEVSKVLERELVHRVKNNLAIISALLTQQARSAGDEIVSDALKNAASRIKSIAVVHDVLDANRQTEFIDVAEIFSQLIGGIRESFCPKHIQIEATAKNAVVHIDVALPLALLVNELVTNAIKHAFVDRASGRVTLTCITQNGEIEIRVADDGVGVPANETGEPRQPRMIIALASQIGGSLQCRVTQGTEWILRFPFDTQREFAERGKTSGR